MTPGPKYVDHFGGTEFDIRRALIEAADLEPPEWLDGARLLPLA